MLSLKTFLKTLFFSCLSLAIVLGGFYVYKQFKSQSLPYDTSIELNKRFGKITASTSKQEVLNFFPPESVATTQISLDRELASDAVSVFFAGKALEFFVLWTEQSPPKPQIIMLEAEHSAWSTKDNIRIGTSLQKLEEINNKPILLTDQAHGYPGYVESWEGGNLEGKNMQILFDISALDESKDYISSSALSLEEKQNTKVKRLFLYFNQ